MDPLLIARIRRLCFFARWNKSSLDDSDVRLGKKEAAARLQLEFPRLQSNGNSDLFSHRASTMYVIPQGESRCGSNIPKLAYYSRN